MKLVGQLSLPIPPLAEQKRIVAKVDELMALCDRLEAQQQERDTRHAALARASLARFAEAPTPANLDFLFHKSYTITPADLRKSILTLAVQGKLVPQDPNDPEMGYRACLGLLHLARRYSKERLEAACARALAIGSPTRKSVVSILEQNLDQQPLPTPAPAATLPAHANVRGPEYYQPPQPEDTVVCSTTPH